MIGQRYTIHFVQDLLEKQYMPRFMLIVGDKGSGRKTLADLVAHKFKAYMRGNHCVMPDIRIAAIRDVITDAYKQKTEMLYIIPDIDNMSQEAQNALLKLTEEPPNKAYFVMTIEDLNNVLSTIKSRAYTLFLDKYKPEEIREYAQSTGKLEDAVIDTMVLDVCETPGEVNTFIECGAEQFYEFVDKVVENVDNVTIANMLKIVNSLDIKDDGKGYDVILFLKVFMRCCMIHGASTQYDSREAYQYIRMIPPTSTILTKLKVRGANKNMLLTDWLLSVRS
jgi:replication-associated recombination protein RarA